MKNIKLLYLLILGFSVFPAAALRGGPLLYLQADFGGGLTTPFISDTSLKQLNSGALKMSGMMSSLLISGNLEGGYVFDSNRFFGLRQGHPFSALGVFAYLGVGQGNSGQKITADTGSGIVDTFVFINFIPVVNFGVSAKAYFFRNRLALGAHIGGRLIADTRPSFLSYTSPPSTPKVGEIIVTEDMMKKMNPLMFSVKGMMEYNIPVLETTDIVMGWYTRYNIYRPKYLTAPPELAGAADLSKPVLDFWLNSFDFGVSIGFAFKL